MKIASLSGAVVLDQHGRVRGQAKSDQVVPEGYEVTFKVLDTEQMIRWYNELPAFDDIHRR